MYAFSVGKRKSKVYRCSRPVGSQDFRKLLIQPTNQAKLRDMLHLGPVAPLLGEGASIQLPDDMTD